jgi:hypothetical protein
MSTHDPARPIDLHLSGAELEIVRTALRHLFASEDDPDTIAVVKALLARLPRPDEGED